MGSKQRGVVGTLVLAAAVCFILYGAARGEIAVVMNKAVNICLECKGIG